VIEFPREGRYPGDLDMKKHMCACAALLLAVGCGPVGSSATSGGEGSSNFVSTWPTFTGDCQGHWGDTIRVLNGSIADQMSFTVQDWVPGAVAADTQLMIGFPAGSLNVPLSMDWPAQHQADVLLQIGNTQYTNRSNPNGEILGTMTVRTFALAQHIATVEFSGATLLGQDSVVAGTFRCGLNGTLAVKRFTRTALGARCQDDHECGGSYSGFVCDNQSFVCVAGCHTMTDCPFGMQCGGGDCS
jgi:hypothetical protein